MSTLPSPSSPAFPTAWLWASALLSGLLLALAFPPLQLHWLAWIGLTPLCLALWHGPSRAAATGWKARLAGVAREPGPFALGYACGLVFFLVSLFWLTEVSGPGWFVLSLWLALFPAAWGWIVGRFLRPADPRTFLSSSANLRLALAAAAAWTGLEWLRAFEATFLAFGWNALGVALHQQLPFVQLSAWTGVGGLSFLLVWSNVIAAATIVRFRLEIGSGRIRPHFDFTLTLALILGVFVHGFATLSRTDPTAQETELKIAMVQPAVPLEQKFDERFEDETLAKLRQFTEIAIATGPQLILWPEASTPRGIFVGKKDMATVRELRAKAEIDYLIGSLDYDFDDDGKQACFNAAMLLPKEGGDAQFYRKLHLVPFGEYIPYRKSFPLFAWIAGTQVPLDFARGKNPVVFTLTQPALRLAPLICFEDTLPELTRRAVKLDTHLLVNLTNDGWFNRSAGSAQHLAHAIFRAAENRRPLLRCANTGVTCVIDEFGRVRFVLKDEAGDTFAPGVLASSLRVRTNPPGTFFTEQGEIFSILCLLFAGVATVATWWAARN
ncbi:MAG: apolipoprotein N-acyltransferase [Verrucomicrobia bacterium]|nr:apolipoprotein N-acyltransferase [Verrucomicrobiota bacterium]